MFWRRVGRNEDVYYLSTCTYLQLSPFPDDLRREKRSCTGSGCQTCSRVLRFEWIATVPKIVSFYLTSSLARLRSAGSSFCREPFFQGACFSHCLAICCSLLYIIWNQVTLATIHVFRAIIFSELQKDYTERTAVDPPKSSCLWSFRAESTFVDVGWGTQ